MRESYIPYGGYWCTPFARWQGSFAHLHALEFAAHTARAELARRDIPPAAFDYAVLGTTVPQHHSFFGAPWMMGMIGNDRVGGPTINQACATAARCLLAAQQEIAAELSGATLVLTADRCSNGPHVYYPNPQGPGGTGAHEDWVLDNFGHDPYAAVAMIDTAENVARKYQLTREEQHDVVLRRHEQYRAAPAGFRARYMTLPFPVPDAHFQRVRSELADDQGIHPTTREGLQRLKPVREGGTVTYGSQTHPADGNAAVIVATRERARALSRRPEIEIRLAGFGLARTDKAHMPQAPVPAAKRALQQADLGIGQMAAIKSHNPFAVNDIVFARETGTDLMAMNNNGCSLVWGHPQGPTGLRAIIELVEELVDRGGGYGLFHGCAAGDTAMAVVLQVSDSQDG
jgi:acetyl-CoA acetyltransferase family protein